MNKDTYGRMLVTEFKKLEEYDYLAFIRDLEKERLSLLKTSSEDEIKSKRLYKEHYLVRFFKKTFIEMEEIYDFAKCKNSKGVPFIDIKSIGDNMRFKNDLMTLRCFILKMEQKGYKRHIKAS